MKTAIVTHYLPNHQALADITSANKKEYADRHGYGFIEIKDNYSPWKFDFQRVQIVYDQLFFHESYDAIWWLGCDTMIMNHTLKIEDFLKPEDKSLYIHKDINGINNDSFVMKKSEWSKAWLEFSMSKYPEYKDDCWESQRVLQHFVETDIWKDGLAILPHPGINSYFYDKYNWPETTPGHFNKGDFVLHLPGMNLQQRLDLFQSKRVNDLFIK